MPSRLVATISSGATSERRKTREQEEVDERGGDPDDEQVVPDQARGLGGHRGIAGVARPRAGKTGSGEQARHRRLEPAQVGDSRGAVRMVAERDEVAHGAAVPRCGRPAAPASARPAAPRRSRLRPRARRTGSGRSRSGPAAGSRCRAPGSPAPWARRCPGAKPRAASTIGLPRPGASARGLGSASARAVRPSRGRWPRTKSATAATASVGTAPSRRLVPAATLAASACTGSRQQRLGRPRPSARPEHPARPSRPIDAGTKSTDTARLMSTTTAIAGPSARTNADLGQPQRGEAGGDQQAGGDDDRQDLGGCPPRRVARPLPGAEPARASPRAGRPSSR